MKRATWEVRPQGWNLKELAGEHYNGWSLRFNWINAGNLTGTDSDMKARLKTLPD